MTNIKTSEPMVSSIEAAQQVARVVRGAQTYIDEAAARTIAGWWASPGVIGSTLAAFSTGAEVDAQTLLDDIDRTMREEPGMSWADADALGALRALIKEASGVIEWTDELDALSVETVPEVLDRVADDVVSQWMGKSVPWGSLNALMPADFSWDPTAGR